MKTKTNKIVMVFTVFLLTFSGAIGIAKEPTKQEATHKTSLKQGGKFREIKLINNVLGFKVELFLNNEGTSLVAGENGQAEQNYDTIKGGYKNVHGVHFIITKLGTNKEIASGEIELDWITKNKGEVLKGVIDKLKEKGIVAKVEVDEANNTLIITIDDVSMRIRSTK